MAIHSLERELRTAAIAYESAHRGPKRFLRMRPASPFVGGVDGFVREVCADSRRHVGAMVRLALDDATQHPFAAAPWAALVASLGSTGRRATEEWFGVGRWSDADRAWCSARTRAEARSFVAQLGGAKRDGCVAQLGGAKRATAEPAAQSSARASLAALFTSAPSGWVREAALEQLAAHEAVEVLPFIVARLADWVPQVRAAARKALDGCLSPLNARALLAAMPELVRARRRTHFEDEALARQVEALLRSQARTGLFLERLDDPDNEVRRAAFNFALETEGAAVVGGVIRRAFDAGDAIVLKRALAALGRLGEDAAGREEREALMGSALTHRSRLVRRRALSEWFAEGAALPALSEALVERALLDPTREVRSIAQRASGRTREGLAVFYRAHAAEDDATRAAAGPSSRASGLSAAWHALAEFGDETALARVRAALATPWTLATRARAAAVRTLRLGLGSRAVPELIELLREPTLARDAARGLAALDECAPLETLETLALAAEPRLVQSALILARCVPGRYAELRVLLRAAHAGSPIATKVQARVEQWLRQTNGRMPRPDSTTAIELCALLSRAAALRTAERAELAVRLGC